jgi:hypothetical protein
MDPREFYRLEAKECRQQAASLPRCQERNWLEALAKHYERQARVEEEPTPRPELRA